MTVFWDVSWCSLVKIDRRFRGVYCPQNQGVTSQKTAIFYCGTGSGGERPTTTATTNDNFIIIIIE
jgi:hypothetical protein